MNGHAQVKSTMNPSMQVPPLSRSWSHSIPSSAEWWHSSLARDLHIRGVLSGSGRSSPHDLANAKPIPKRNRLEMALKLAPFWTSRHDIDYIAKDTQELEVRMWGAHAPSFQHLTRGRHLLAHAKRVQGRRLRVQRAIEALGFKIVTGVHGPEITGVDHARPWLNNAQVEIDHWEGRLRRLVLLKGRSQREEATRVEPILHDDMAVE